jgi:hypothetical protein
MLFRFFNLRLLIDVSSHHNVAQLTCTCKYMHGLTLEIIQQLWCFNRFAHLRSSLLSTWNFTWYILVCKHVDKSLLPQHYLKNKQPYYVVKATLQRRWKCVFYINKPVCFYEFSSDFIGSRYVQLSFFYGSFSPFRHQIMLKKTLNLR